MHMMGKENILRAIDDQRKVRGRADTGDSGSET
jgi:hypothetical protein